MASYDEDDDGDFEVRPRKKKTDPSKKSRPKKSSSSSTTGTSRGVVIWIIVGGVVALVLFGFMLIPVIRTYVRESRRPVAHERMKRLALAMYNYHDVFNGFPPGVIAREDGTQMTGWEARLLPYVDEAPTYNLIDMNFPWNSPQNEGPFSKQILAFQNPAFQSSTEPNASHIAGNSYIFPVNKAHRIADTIDGTSNTIAIGEVSAGFKHWGDPTNVRDPGLGLGNTPEQFGGPYQGGTHFMILDGTVRFIKSDIDPAILKAMATPNGGERMDF